MVHSQAPELTLMMYLLFLRQDGELVLLDGGCEYFGYVSDITRTWPVNGKYVGRCNVGLYNVKPLRP